MVFYLDVDTPDNYADLDSAFVEVKGSLVPYFFHIDSINGNKAVVTFEDLTPTRLTPSPDTTSTFPSTCCPNSRATNSTSTKWSGSR